VVFTQVLKVLSTCPNFLFNQGSNQKQSWLACTHKFLTASCKLHVTFFVTRSRFDWFPGLTVPFLSVFHHDISTRMGKQQWGQPWPKHMHLQYRHNYPIFGSIPLQNKKPRWQKMLTLTATHYHHSTLALFLSTNTKRFFLPSANAYACVVCILTTIMLKYACA